MIGARQDSPSYGDPLAVVRIYAQADEPPGGSGGTVEPASSGEARPSERDSPWGSNEPVAYGDPPEGSGSGDPPPGSDEDMPAW